MAKTQHHSEQIDCISQDCEALPCPQLRRAPEKSARNLDVLNRLARLYGELFAHDGFGDLRVEIRILRKGQKEVILHCGKQYRFIVDATDPQPLNWGVWKAEDYNAVSNQTGAAPAETT